MSTSDKVLIIVAGVLIGLLSGFVVHELNPSVVGPEGPQGNAGTSPVNSTFTTQKQLSITMNLANSTTTSVQNTSANDAYILTFNYACTGVGTSNLAYTGAGGIANLTVKAATTSTNLTGSTPTSNVAANTNLAIPAANIATSSTVTVNSSSSVQVPTPLFLTVPAGAYLTFITNATNTAVCTFAAETISS